MITTYQAGKLIVIGSKDGEKLHQTPLSLSKPMGIALNGKRLAIACLDEILIFSAEENIQEVLNKDGSSYDKVFAHRATYHTGILDVHDLEFGEGVIWGVNTLTSCLSIYDIGFSFRPKWKPPFIDAIVPEDRCHLNGMTLLNNMPRYVTALSKTNVEKGWRIDKMKTGLLMSVPDGEVILDGLAMPHSPRIYNNLLYFLESGNGNLVVVDPDTKAYEVIFNFGCFVRGLSFIGNVAVIGKSKIRETSGDFNDLKVKEGSVFAGLIFFDIEKKQIIGGINYTNSVEEIFDIKVLENSINPAVIASNIDSTKNIVTFPGNKFWRKDS
jgi:uncharacterized protein (TIGR03032 family)